MTCRNRIPTIFLLLFLLPFLSIEIPADHADAKTFKVNTTGDEEDATLLDDECDSDTTTAGLQCTLRAAIMQSNRLKDADTIIFNIPGPGPHTLQPNSPLPDILHPVLINGYSQPGSSKNTLASGTNAVLMIELDGSNAGSPANGLLIKAGSCEISGLVINRFRESGSGVCEGHGIVLDVKGDNVIQGCFIGTNAAGTSALPNQGSGVAVFDLSLAGTCTNNMIGGFTNEARNLISGNGATGIQISQNSGGGNLVVGNLIGVDKNGTAALGNALNGIFVEAPNNTIGGQYTTYRNIISGNLWPGIYLGEYTSGNKIEGNYIGVDISGKLELENKGGITIYESSGNTVGGATADHRNIISGNNGHGIKIIGSSAQNNKVSGNYIGLGTDSAGPAVALANLNGITIDGAPSNTIGGITAGERNVISGNDESGIWIKGAGATGITVQGNYIGTNESGSAAMANGQFGIRVDGAPGNTIGGITGGARNVISGNDDSGIIISEAAATGNKVIGNYIGINAAGAAAVANGKCGIQVFKAPNTIIGGTTSQASNVISGNKTEGVAVVGGGATGNQVQGNFIGTNAAGQAPIPNLDGVAILNASANTIGGSTTAAGNVISGNTEYGVWIHQSSSTTSHNKVQANVIGSDSAVTLTGLGNGKSGVFLENAANNLVGGLLLEEGNWISGNGESGISIQGANAALNKVQGNYIGTNDAGDAALGNTHFGVRIVNAPQNTIGGTSPQARNVISGNQESGIQIYQSGAAQNLVQGNHIGTNVAGDAAIANDRCGVHILEAPNNIIGGTAAGAGNLISGNDDEGIGIAGTSATGNQVQGNYIGLNASASAALPNNLGIALFNTTGNTIGGIKSQARNIISGNTASGVIIQGSTTSFNTIAGNYIGLDPSGTVTSLGNGQNGVYISGAPQNTIGGTDPGALNVISANTKSGVYIDGNNAKLNQVLGNYIGTDPTGSATGFGNTENGMIINNAPQNKIGGTASGARNIISGNKKSGIEISQSGAIQNQVLGNYIGTDAAGASALANTHFGVRIVNAPNNIIGGTSAAARNVISGNKESGIQIYQNSATKNQVQGNYIGTNAAGDKAVANDRCGIHILEAPGNTIGGTTAGAKNIISGNDDEGIGIAGASATGNRIQGNYIGLDRSGQSKLANERGVAVYNASSTVIGGAAAGAANAIAGNTQNGVRIDGSLAYSNKVQGNFIGTNLSGNTSGLGNGKSGVSITGGAHDNSIGGTSAGALNVLSGNAEHGVNIVAASWSNKVKGNLIGTDINGLVGGLGNGKSGVYINGASNNTIGGSKATARNIISGNIENGVQIVGAGAKSNKIQGNYIGTTVTGASALSNGLHGVSVNGAPNNIIGGAVVGAGNIIAGNAFSGIALVGTGATDNNVLGNFIGTQSDGVSALANGANGITIDSAADNAIGGTSGGEGNTIAFNTQDGIVVVSVSGNAVGNAVKSNTVFSNGDLGIDLGNNGVTANDAGDTDSGPNNYQNYPVLDAATSGSWGTRILGSLDSPPLVTYTMQFFSNSTCDASNYGEGQALIHSTTQTAGAIDIALSATIAQGQYITATATDSQGNTSEFSPCMRIVTDTDKDGIPDATEADGPNSGDGNRDGTPDYQQPYVTSVENSGDGAYVTLVTSSGLKFVDVKAVGNPSPGDTPPGATFPIGFLEFTVETPLSGMTFAVEIFLPPSTSINAYFKHGRTPHNSAPHWYNFSYDSTTGAQFTPNKVTLFFKDGQRGDSDLMSNGRIVDPGGPAFYNTPPVSVDDSYTMFADTTLSIAAPGVLGNDTDADNDVLTAVLESDVNDGSLSLDSSGALVYEPDAGFVGKDSFTYKAYDGHSYSDIAVVTISVRGSGTTTIRIPDDFLTIQEAVDYAIDGDTVLVADGTYKGSGNKNIDFKGKAITVRSANGPASCIIDCEQDGRGFLFISGEGADSVLSGFTITNGYLPTLPGGAIYCDASSPTISNNVIVKNKALWGGGIYCNDSSPLILGNVIRANTVMRYRYGGGIMSVGESAPLICNNIVSGNHAYYGGGLFCSDSSSPTVLNSSFAYNSCTTAFQHSCGASIQAWSSSPIIINSILWGDYLGTASHQIYVIDGSAMVTYSNIDQDGYGDGSGNPDSSGNMRLAPHFVLDGYWDDQGTPTTDDDVWVDGDYRLQENSPCIDAGTNAPADLPSHDFEKDPRIFDGDEDGTDTVDMGADEYVISTCSCDWDGDNDVDGSDLAALADGSNPCSLTDFANELGETDCR